MNMQIRFTKKGREEFLKIISVFSEFAGTRSANKNYRMIYHVTKNTIWIVDVWDRRNDPSKLVSRIK